MRACAKRKPCAAGSKTARTAWLSRVRCAMWQCAIRSGAARPICRKTCARFSTAPGRQAHQAGSQFPGRGGLRLVREAGEHHRYAAEARRPERTFQLAFRSAVQALPRRAAPFRHDRKEIAGAMARPLALTIGEPAGIGPELTLAVWQNRSALSLPPFYVLGDAQFLFKAREIARASMYPWRRSNHRRPSRPSQRRCPSFPSTPDHGGARTPRRVERAGGHRGHPPRRGGRDAARRRPSSPTRSPRMSLPIRLPGTRAYRISGQAGRRNDRAAVTSR